MILALEIVGGLIVLVLGADWLVRGASRLAFALGVPALIVGLTVVAFGTSAPELAVSVGAALVGEAGVGLGNVFGSNTINILLVLGLSAAFAPLPVSKQLMRVDVPFMVAASFIVYAMCWNGILWRWEGVALVLGLGLYLGIQVYLGKTQKEVLEEFAETEKLVEQAPRRLTLALGLGYCVVGFAMLVAGAHYLVEGAVALAQRLGVSDEIVGLTVVSVGTSLPEIVTSVVAAAKGSRDMAIGNVVGSNLYNLLAVLGVACSVAPEPIPVSMELIRIDLPVMLLAAVICIPIFRSGKAVSRLEGTLMVTGYAAYLGFQVWNVLRGAS
jgi:cation:H+ antiporter